MPLYSYLDWCPRPTGSVRSRLSIGVIPVSELEEFIGEKISSDDLTYVCRNDGIFIFTVNFTQTNEMKSSGWRVSIAHQISHLVKIHCGHNHVFNQTMHDHPHEHPFPTLSVDPIELLHVNRRGASYYRDRISNDAFIADLDVLSYKNSGEKVSALLMLRNQYAKLFEKSKQTREILKSKKTDIIQIFGKKLEIYHFSHKPVIFSVLIISFFSALISFSLDTVQTKQVVVLSLNSGKILISKFWDMFSYLSVVAVMLLFVQQISMKRRRILQALSRAKGYLLHAEIYDSVIAGILEKGKKMERNPFGFSTAIQILDEHIELEKKKRRQFFYLVIAVYILFYEKTYVDYVKGTGIEEIMPPLQYLGKIVDTVIK